VVVYALMQTESCVAKFIQLIRILDIITELIVYDAGRMNKARERKVAFLADGVAVPSDIIKP
jgi:hypothetical protein